MGMFVRTKRFKNNEYAYLVQNKWTKEGTRQKTVRYLGKVICPQVEDPKIKIEPNKGTTDLLGIRELEKKSYKETLRIILNQVIREIELKNYQNISINISKSEVLLDGKPCVLRLKGGFLCDYTLKRLFNLRYIGQEKLEFGYKLAESLLMCGISLDKERFVELCNKAFSEHEKRNKTPVS